MQIVDQLRSRHMPARSTPTAELAGARRELIRELQPYGILSQRVSTTRTGSMRAGVLAPIVNARVGAGRATDAPGARVARESFLEVLRAYLLEVDLDRSLPPTFASSFREYLLYDTGLYGCVQVAQYAMRVDAGELREADFFTTPAIENQPDEHLSIVHPYKYLIQAIAGIAHENTRTTADARVAAKRHIIEQSNARALVYDTLLFENRGQRPGAVASAAPLDEFAIED
jgi:hypothetical protein